MSGSPFSFTRRRVVMAAVAVTSTVASLGTVPALAADGPYPNRPITLVVPYPPGGSNDVFARQIAKEIGATLELVTMQLHQDILKQDYLNLL